MGCSNGSSYFIIIVTVCLGILSGLQIKKNGCLKMLNKLAKVGTQLIST